MASMKGTVMRVQVDEALERAFVEAAARERTTPTQVFRTLMEDFVRASLHREAQRQSRRVADAPDAEETMRDVMAAQGFVRE